MTMRWAEHVALIGEKKNAHNILVRDHGRIPLKYI
jgi:hypothetical protein